MEDRLISQQGRLFMGIERVTCNVHVFAPNAPGWNGIHLFLHSGIFMDIQVRVASNTFRWINTQWQILYFIGMGQIQLI